MRGFQVAPAELEGHLLDHPDIADVCVVAAPDEYSGELPFAFVSLKDGVRERVLKDRKEEERVKQSIMKVRPLVHSSRPFVVCVLCLTETSLRAAARIGPQDAVQVARGRRVHRGRAEEPEREALAPPLAGPPEGGHAEREHQARAAWREEGAGQAVTCEVTGRLSTRAIGFVWGRSQMGWDGTQGCV